MKPSTSCESFVLFSSTVHSTATTELFLFLTPHIISTDEDIDRLRNSLQRGSDLLKDVPVGPRINPQPGDTLRVKPDSGRGRPGGIPQ